MSVLDKNFSFSVQNVYNLGWHPKIAILSFEQEERFCLGVHKTDYLFLFGCKRRCFRVRSKRFLLIQTVNAYDVIYLTK